MLIRKKVNFLYLVAILVTVILISIFVSNQRKKEDFSKDFIFIVDSVRETPSLRCYYYDKNKNELLRVHTFYSPSVIMKGDIIQKKANSKFITVKRKDSLKGEFIFNLNID